MFESHSANLFSLPLFISLSHLKTKMQDEQGTIRKNGTSKKATNLPLFLLQDSNAVADEIEKELQQSESMGLLQNTRSKGHNITDKSVYPFAGSQDFSVVAKPLHSFGTIGMSTNGNNETTNIFSLVSR